jgi:hypothetical protein
VSRPLSLLRRPGDSGPLEHFGRDGCWRSDSRPGLVSGEDLRALLEVDGEQAEALMKLWTSKPYRASGPLDSGARRSATVGTIRRRHKKEP